LKLADYKKAASNRGLFYFGQRSFPQINMLNVLDRPAQKSSTQPAKLLN
jgi:hypothetical protein